MSIQRFTILPGAEKYAASLQIHFPTADPLGWLHVSRSALAYLLEGFCESDLPNGNEVRAYTVRLLHWLAPLPTQWEAGARALTTAPAATEVGGVWFTGEGVALRFGAATQFEELHNIGRALFALLCSNAYDLTDPYRAGVLSLTRAILPTASEALAFCLDGPPEHYTFDAGERAALQGVATTWPLRVGLLRRALNAPAERQNQRFFSALAECVQAGKIDTDTEAFILDYVATGCRARSVAV